MVYKLVVMYFLLLSSWTARDSVRHTLLVCAMCAAGVGVSGCKTTAPGEEPPPLFTMEELVSANQKAAINAWAAGKRAAEAEVAAERALVQTRIAEAVAKGRTEGDTLAVKRIAAEQAAALEDAAAKAATCVATTTELLAKTPLFGNRKLRSDKGRALEAGQLLEVINVQLEAIGYELVVAVPCKSVKTLGNCDEQKVLLSMTTDFNESFVERVQMMSIMDGLNLLNKLYGFSAWFAHDAKIIWLGFAASPAAPQPNSKVDLHFSEKDFIERNR